MHTSLAVEAEKLEGYHSCKTNFLQEHGASTPHKYPKPRATEMGKGACLRFGGKNSGDSVCLGDQVTTFQGMNNPIITTPACGVHYLVFDYW